MASIHYQIIFYDNLEISINLIFEKIYESCKNSEYDFKIKVAINPGKLSENDTQEIGDALAAVFKPDDYSFQIMERNIGHGSAHNFLFFQDPPATFLVIANPDGAPNSSCVKELTKILEENASASGVDAQQLPFSQPKAWDTDTFQTDWISGAMSMIRRDSFEKIEGFDENFFLHGDDVDLSFRLREYCGPTLHCARALFYHGKTLNRNGYPNRSLNEIYFGALGSLLVAYKFRLYYKLLRMLIDLLKHNSVKSKRIIFAFFKCKKQIKRMIIKKISLKHASNFNWQFTKHDY